MADHLAPASGRILKRANFIFNQFILFPLHFSWHTINAIIVGWLAYLFVLRLVLTVSISLSQQLHLYGKSYFWTKFFIQPPETQKTPN
jgi:hypothetical protein